MMKKLLLCIIAAAAVFAVSCSGLSAPRKDKGDLVVTFIDVGKGDCILIEHYGQTVMIDTGYEKTSSDVLTFLKNSGVEKLDHLIITHYDKDHVGGAAAIVQAIDVGTVYLPAYEGRGFAFKSFINAVREKNIRAVTITEDTDITIGECVLTIFASDIEYINEKGEEGNDNDCSLVISAVFDKDRYLFAGDLERDGIDSFLAGGRGSFDVVKMPHHGEKEKNSEEFISAVAPKIAVITDSREESAGGKLVKLLEENKCAVYRTAECGTIRITSKGEGRYTADRLG